MTLFVLLAILLTVLTVGLVARPLLRAGQGAHPVAATLTALAIPAGVLVMYLAVSNYDWDSPPRQASAPSATPDSPAAASMQEAIDSLENKLKENPADEEGWILLGSSYLTMSRPADAAKAYQRALDISGGRNVAARLGAAEASIVLDPGALAGAAGQEIEAVLTAEPRNPKALWYGGLRALSRGDKSTARTRWRILLELAPPERVRQIIESQLAELDGGAAGEPAERQVAASTTSGRSIEVRVSVSDAVSERIAASAPLFIFVRDPANPGPPLAVIRRQASELPLTVRISDADVMLPGRSLANMNSAALVARVANGGDPIAKPGDVFGEASWTSSAPGAAPVPIVIDQVVQAR